MKLSQLFRLLTWSSPAFPTGAFSYSHGIEYAVEERLVTNAAQLQDWVGWIVRHGALYSDAVLLAHAFRAAEAGDDGLDRAKLDEIAELAAAMRGTAETAMESLQQGASFFDTAQAVWPRKRMAAFSKRTGAKPALPIAVALLCAGAVPLPETLGAYLHAAMANLVSAGVRLVPLGQTDGQRSIAALEGAVTDTVGRALATALDDLATAAPMVDWTSMRHETQYTRLFRS
ncbi:MAG TPA: urease accessory protein UreF [Alphaproteobacteria bacterium]